MNVLVYLRVTPNSSTGSVYIRVTSHSQRLCDHSVARGVPLTDFQEKTKRLRPCAPNAAAINALLDRRLARLSSYHLECEGTGVPLSAAIVRGIVAYDRQADVSLPEAFRSFLSEMKRQVEVGELEQSTYNTYEARLRGVEQLQIKANLRKITCLTLSEGTILQLFAHSSAKAAYRAKTLQLLRRVLDYQRRLGTIPRNPLEGVRYRAKYEKKLLYLTAKELHRLESESLPALLRPIAACYLFSCYTGLAYSDLKSFRPDAVSEVGGRWAIRVARAKTGTVSFIPLTIKALALIEQHPEGFRVPSNQVYNRKLKEVAAWLRIDKPLTTHTARKTFAMVALNQWRMSTESVQKMMGHRSVNELRVYAHVDESRVLSEFPPL